MQNAAPVQLNQVRDFGQIISATFQFLKQNWRPLLRALAVTCLPLALLSGFFMGKTMGDIQSLSFGEQVNDPTAMFSGMMESMLPLMLGYLLMVAAFLLMMAVSYEYLCAYHFGEHMDITPGALFQRAIGNIGSYLGSSVLSIVLFMVGLMLCVLPGFYVLSVLALVFACIAFERSGAVASLSRSNELVNGHFWEVLGLVIVIGLIQWLITAALMLPFTIVSMVVTFNSTFDAITTQGAPALPPWMTFFTAVSTALQMAVSILTYPIVCVALSMKYFSLKETKEGTSLRAKVERFEGA